MAAEDPASLAGALGTINLKCKCNGEEDDCIKIGSKCSTGKVHHLPCCVKFNGPCPVSDYFKPRISGAEVDGMSVEEAYFRGRKLQGATIGIPDGYTGFVLVNNNAGDSSWEAKARFDSITYWNHETLPSSDDSFIRLFHWMAVADALHQSVTPEDVASSFTSLDKAHMK